MFSKTQKSKIVSKNKLSLLENLPIPIFRPLRSSRADWHQNQKVGPQKLEKIEWGCVGFRDPKFLNEIKIKEYDAKKPFSIWLRVSGLKLHVSECRLKNGLSSNELKHQFFYSDG